MWLGRAGNGPDKSCARIASIRLPARTPFYTQGAAGNGASMQT